MRCPLHWSARCPAIRRVQFRCHLLTHRYLGVLVVIGSAWFAAAPTTSIAAEDADTQASHVFQETVRPLLVRYCSGCHGEDTQEADIALTSYASPQSARADRETWMAVDEAVLFGSMPPEDEPQPTRDERKQISSWIQSLFAVDCTNDRDPGRETIRRLNRGVRQHDPRPVGIGFESSRGLSFG